MIGFLGLMDRKHEAIGQRGSGRTRQSGRHLGGRKRFGVSKTPILSYRGRMPKNHKFDSDIDEILKRIGTPSVVGRDFRESDSAPKITTFVEQSGKLIAELQLARETVSPIRFGPIGITLGRSDNYREILRF
ncbi:MAG: hypothetical protein R3F31_16080 [Verrucomicrobiales bacterium]